MSRMCVAAHLDDDLYFMSPDILRDVASGESCGTVYLTSGASVWDDYPMRRETGVKSAWAQMAGLLSDWDEETVVLAGKTVATSMLKGSKVRLVFLRLPDGGYGEAEPHHLRLLHEGRVRTLLSLGPLASTYTRDDLVKVLVAAMDLYGARTVRHHDPRIPYGRLDLDHYDHVAAAQFTLEAVQAHPRRPGHIGYVGYEVSRYPDNLSREEQEAKYAAFVAYAQHDPIPFERSERLSRQYRVRA